MRLAELARQSGVPRSTIKFYIREGMLPAGEPRARNQATYGPAHLERLALIRALREVAGLRLEVVARVTAQLDRGFDGDPIGEALLAIHAPATSERAKGDAAELEKLRAEVYELMRGLPWTTGDERHFFAEEIAGTLLQVRQYLYPDYPVAALLPLARVAWLLSEVEFEHAPGGPRVPLRARRDDLAEPTRRAILGSVLFERIFAALHRAANSMRSIRISEELPVPPADAPAKEPR
ncbi:MAG TPA: MerR family transcriptional regulator [Myxococcota bacterium]|nr:MerR family transcriptional regulator [Myxococcota bacterium]